jgi:hypothetical protein
VLPPDEVLQQEDRQVSLPGLLRALDGAESVAEEAPSKQAVEKAAGETLGAQNNSAQRQ